MINFGKYEFLGVILTQVGGLKMQRLKFFLAFILGTIKILVGVIFFIATCFDHYNASIMVLGILGVVCIDILDGRLLPENKSRRILDNLGDKIVIHFIIGAAFVYEVISPLWWIPIIVKDLILIVGSGVLLSKKIVIFPTKFQKLTQLVLAFAGILLVLNYLLLCFGAVLLYYFLSIIGLIKYVKIFLMRSREGVLS